MDAWIFPASPADIGYWNILVEYCSYSTRIFYVFNMDAQISPTLTVNVDYQNILVNYCMYSARIF